jgi:3-methyladenine DNA glycosylase AlkD
MNEIINRIRKSLIDVSDTITKEKALRLTSGAKCIGVAVPKIKELVKNYKQEFSELDFQNACEIADGFFIGKCREEILFSIFILAVQKKKLTEIKWERIENWLESLDNWETCDQLSSNIITPILVQETDLIKNLFQLTQSDNKWKRRFAVATVANINHGGRAFPKETFVICKPLLTDKEKEVTKAVGWAIREISKKCPEETFDFLEENIGHISKGLLKESSELLPDKERNEIMKIKENAST